MSISPLARTSGATLALAFLVACGSGYDGGDPPPPTTSTPVPGIAAAFPAQCVTFRGGTVADPEVVPVSLSNPFVVPPPVDNTSSSASGALTLNRTSGELTGSITVANLSGTATAVHVHLGFAGLNDVVLVTLVADNAVAGKFDVPAGTLLAAPDLASFAAGGMYLDMHTVAQQDGEIRGQIIPGGIDLVRCALSGDFEVPAVTTTGLGVGYATVDTVGGNLVANVRTSGFSDATEAHVHRANAGLNGAAILPLVQTGGAGTELWEASGTLSGLDLAGYLAGELYLNVHTPANPDGLIRSQLVPEDISVLRFVLEGAQEVPPVTTAATAVAYTTVHRLSGAVAANARTSNLSGANGAHLHQGAIGINGPITIPLVQPDLALTPELWATSATFTAPQLTAFLASQTYLNVHSASFPDGEIRGQIIQPQSP
jgi:hypothetical protein